MAENELKIVIGLHRANAYIDAKSNEIFSRYGLTTGQFGVLEVLYHKGDLCVGEVQNKILSSSGTIPLIIRNLEKRGLIIRFTDSYDKRKCILHLTKVGERLIREVYPQNETCIVASLDVLCETEKQELVRLLKKIGGQSSESRYKGYSEGTGNR